MTTVEIESILTSEELAALLETAEVSGQVRQSELVEVLEPLELDPLETEAVYQELDRRGIELLVEPETESDEGEAPPPPPAHTRSRRRPTRCSSSCARPAATRC